MPQTATPQTATMSDRRPRTVPGAVHAVLRGKGRLRAALFADGRIAALGPGLLKTLGFAPSDDLRELRFSSFWGHDRRAEVECAFRRARSGRTVTLTLDLGYLTGTAASCTVVLAPLGQGDLTLATLYCRSREPAPDPPPSTA